MQRRDRSKKSLPQARAICGASERVGRRDSWNRPHAVSWRNAANTKEGQGFCFVVKAWRAVVMWPSRRVGTECDDYARPRALKGRQGASGVWVCVAVTKRSVAPSGLKRPVGFHSGGFAPGQIMTPPSGAQNACDRARVNWRRPLSPRTNYSANALQSFALAVPHPGATIRQVNHTSRDRERGTPCAEPSDVLPRSSC